MYRLTAIFAIITGLSLLPTSAWAAELTADQAQQCEQLAEVYDEESPEFHRAQLRLFHRRNFRCPELARSQVPSVPTERRRLTHFFTSPVIGRMWQPRSYQFGRRYSYPNEQGESIDWGLHLGEDMELPAGNRIVATGAGKVVYADYHPGSSKNDRNWGGIVILAHWISEDRVMFSLYGHLEIEPNLTKGDWVHQGQTLGTIAPSLTPENGWWEEAHLHFQLNVDPTDQYRGGVLTGYDKGNAAPNRLEDNVAPSQVLNSRQPVEYLLEAEAARNKVR